MKNLITALLVCAVSAAYGFAAPNPPRLEKVNYYKAPDRMQAKSESEFCTVVLDVDYDLPMNQELSGLFAMESTGSDLQVYYGLSEEEDSHIYEFNMPPGSYDFYVGAILGNYEGMMVLTLDGVEINADMDLQLKASSAVYRTDISHIGPDGSELKMVYGNPDGNVPSAQFIQALVHNDKLLIINGLSTDTSSLNYFISNNLTSRFYNTRLDLMHSPSGFLTCVIPVDFSKETCGTDADGWQMAEESFAKTPANFKMDDFHIAAGEPDYFYGFSPCVMMMNGCTRGTAGIGMFDPNCTTGTVGAWAPENYRGPFELWPIPTGSAISGWNSDISGLALKRTPEGLKQVGLNLVPERLIFFCDETSPVAGPEYDAFSGRIPTAQLGNCTPILVLIPEEEYFEFSFTGRHGESISQSSAYYVIPSIEYWDDIFGDPLCDLKFYRNDVLVCSDRIDFPYDTEWDEPADYRLEISTDNVLIDGEIPGFIKATHSFGADSPNLMPPTLTSLRILDTDGNINDRLQETDGAKLIFTGGHFTYNDNYEQGYVYTSFDEVECVAAEYAPTGSDQFSQLEVSKDAEPVLPGYGNLFTADLSSIEAAPEDRWYDLRITIRDESGSEQTQLISPAFFIEATDGIEAVESENMIDLNSADTQIFSIDGRRVDSLDSTNGLYIVRASGKTRKIIIR